MSIKTADPGKPADPGPETAKILLDIKAVNFRPQEPYMLTSGWASPVYIDCRKLISYPKERRRVTEMAVELLDQEIGLDNIDTVAGGETAGIPYASWIAEATDKPMLYVRKKPKKFGRNARIEGDMSEGDRVILIEDLATDGASKISFVEALRTAGGVVSDTFVVFFYGVFAGTEKTLANAGIRMHQLATWHDVLKAAKDGNYFSDEAIAGVQEFLDEPMKWSAAHGGKG